MMGWGVINSRMSCAMRSPSLARSLTPDRVPGCRVVTP
ncbi:hypothetical protein MINT15_08470 [Saccharomonospora viridis]|uniref:Uncharacterized protein n=1 Tax=Saccharomonospora viridis TaxID=1852 RepID=A0A837DDV7_9PSEU|nr:hypothetical protein MINT15_08470 [Saccharomonospora viridis]